MNYSRLVNSFGLITLKLINPCKNQAGKVTSIAIKELQKAPWQITQVRHHWRNRKPRLPYTKPLSFDYSGDMDDHVVKVDLTAPRPGFEEELKEADEITKKIFSLEFSPTSVVMEKMLEDVIKEIQDHPYDIRSLEVEIAKSTVLIRSQIKHCVRFRHDKVSIGNLRKRIATRKEALGKLLVADSEKFDWLTNKLKLKFEMPCKYYPEVKLTKREERKKVARDAATALVKQKTLALEKKLKEERARFDKFKEQELSNIEQELKELGIEEMSNLSNTLIALGREDLVPKQIRIPTAEELIRKKRLEILMKNKEVEDDKIYKAHNFLTPKEMPIIPDTYYF